MRLGSAIALGGAAGLFVLWLGWRRPSELLAIVVASFAIGPQWILAGHLRGGLALAAPLQKALLVAAIAAQAWRFGARRSITNCQRCSSLITQLGLTSNLAAVARREAPASTARTIRSRRSTEYGRVLHRWPPQSSSQLDHNNRTS